MPIRSVKPKPGGTKEIRLNESGALDEICVSDANFVHLEQMDDDSWWLGISRGRGRESVVLHVNFHTGKPGRRGARIRAMARDEGLGCAIRIRDGMEPPWYRDVTREEAKAKGWEGVDA